MTTVVSQQPYLSVLNPRNLFVGADRPGSPEERWAHALHRDVSPAAARHLNASPPSQSRSPTGVPSHRVSFVSTSPSGGGPAIPPPPPPRGASAPTQHRPSPYHYVTVSIDEGAVEGSPAVLDWSRSSKPPPPPLRRVVIPPPPLRGTPAAGEGLWLSIDEPSSTGTSRSYHPTKEGGRDVERRRTEPSSVIDDSIRAAAGPQDVDVDDYGDDDEERLRIVEVIRLQRRLAEVQQAIIEAEASQQHQEAPRAHRESAAQSAIADAPSRIDRPSSAVASQVSSVPTAARTGRDVPTETTTTMMTTNRKGPPPASSPRPATAVTVESRSMLDRRHADTQRIAPSQDLSHVTATPSAGRPSHPVVRGGADDSTMVMSPTEGADTPPPTWAVGRSAVTHGHYDRSFAVVQWDESSARARLMDLEAFGRAVLMDRESAGWTLALGTAAVAPPVVLQRSRIDAERAINAEQRAAEVAAYDERRHDAVLNANRRAVLRLQEDEAARRIGCADSEADRRDDLFATAAAARRVVVATALEADATRPLPAPQPTTTTTTSGRGVLPTANPQPQPPSNIAARQPTLPPPSASAATAPGGGSGTKGRRRLEEVPLGGESLAPPPSHSSIAFVIATLLYETELQESHERSTVAAAESDGAGVLRSLAAQSLAQSARIDQLRSEAAAIRRLFDAPSPVTPPHAAQDDTSTMTDCCGAVPVGAPTAGAEEGTPTAGESARPEPTADSHTPSFVAASLLLAELESARREGLEQSYATARAGWQLDLLEWRQRCRPVNAATVATPAARGAATPSPTISDESSLHGEGSSPHRLPNAHDGGGDDGGSFADDLQSVWDEELCAREEIISAEEPKAFEAIVLSEMDEWDVLIARLTEQSAARQRRDDVSNRSDPLMHPPSSGQKEDDSPTKEGLAAARTAEQDHRTVRPVATIDAHDSDDHRSHARESDGSHPLEGAAPVDIPPTTSAAPATSPAASAAADTGPTVAAPVAKQPTAADVSWHTRVKSEELCRQESIDRSRLVEAERRSRQDGGLAAKAALLNQRARDAAFAHDNISSKPQRAAATPDGAGPAPTPGSAAPTAPGMDDAFSHLAEMLHMRQESDRRNVETAEMQERFPLLEAHWKAQTHAKESQPPPPPSSSNTATNDATVPPAADSTAAVGETSKLSEAGRPRVRQASLSPIAGMRRPIPTGGFLPPPSPPPRDPPAAPATPDVAHPPPPPGNAPPGDLPTWRRLQAPLSSPGEHPRPPPPTSTPPRRVGAPALSPATASLSLPPQPDDRPAATRTGALSGASDFLARLEQCRIWCEALARDLGSAEPLLGHPRALDQAEAPNAADASDPPLLAVLFLAAARWDRDAVDSITEMKRILRTARSNPQGAAGPPQQAYSSVMAVNFVSTVLSAEVVEVKALRRMVELQQWLLSQLIPNDGHNRDPSDGMPEDISLPLTHLTATLETEYREARRTAIHASCQLAVLWRMSKLFPKARWNPDEAVKATAGGMLTVSTLLHDVVARMAAAELRRQDGDGDKRGEEVAAGRWFPSPLPLRYWRMTQLRCANDYAVLEQRLFPRAVCSALDAACRVFSRKHDDHHQQRRVADAFLRDWDTLALFGGDPYSCEGETSHASPPAHTATPTAAAATQRSCCFPPPPMIDDDDNATGGGRGDGAVLLKAVVRSCIAEGEDAGRLHDGVDRVGRVVATTLLPCVVMRSRDARQMRAERLQSAVPIVAAVPSARDGTLTPSHGSDGRRHGTSGGGGDGAVGSDSAAVEVIDDLDDEAAVLLCHALRRAHFAGQATDAHGTALHTGSDAMALAFAPLSNTVAARRQHRNVADGSSSSSTRGGVPVVVIGDLVRECCATALQSWSRASHLGQDALLTEHYQRAAHWAEDVDDRQKDHRAANSIVPPLPQLESSVQQGRPMPITMHRHRRLSGGMAATHHHGPLTANDLQKDVADNTIVLRAKEAAIKELQAAWTTQRHEVEAHILQPEAGSECSRLSMSAIRALFRTAPEQAVCLDALTQAQRAVAAVIMVTSRLRANKVSLGSLREDRSRHLHPHVDSTWSLRAEQLRDLLDAMRGGPS